MRNQQRFLHGYYDRQQALELGVKLLYSRHFNVNRIKDNPMKCTSCKHGTLQPDYIETLFPSHRCDYCHGDFVLLPDYLRWLKKHQQQPNPQPSTISIVDEKDITETQRIMLCPISGRLMTKYKISAQSDHYLDFSPTIQGIWLDHGEWSLLKANGLSQQLHKIFTDHWQLEIRAQESHLALEHIYTQKFGEQDYQRLKAFKVWLDNHEKKDEMLAFLITDTAYNR